MGYGLIPGLTPEETAREQEKVLFFLAREDGLQDWVPHVEPEPSRKDGDVGFKVEWRQSGETEFEHFQLQMENEGPPKVSQFIWDGLRFLWDSLRPPSSRLS